MCTRFTGSLVLTAPEGESSTARKYLQFFLPLFCLPANESSEMLFCPFKKYVWGHKLAQNKDWV